MAGKALAAVAWGRGKPTRAAGLEIEQYMALGAASYVVLAKTGGVAYRALHGQAAAWGDAAAATATPLEPDPAPTGDDLVAELEAWDRGWAIHWRRQNAAALLRTRTGVFYVDVQTAGVAVAAPRPTPHLRREAQAWNQQAVAGTAGNAQHASNVAALQELCAAALLHMLCWDAEALHAAGETLPPAYKTLVCALVLARHTLADVRGDLLRDFGHHASSLEPTLAAARLRVAALRFAPWAEYLALMRGEEGVALVVTLGMKLEFEAGGVVLFLTHAAAPRAADYSCRGDWQPAFDLRYTLRRP